MSHSLHPWCWKCSYPVGFGKLLCRIWSKCVVKGEGKEFSHQDFNVKAAADELGNKVMEQSMGSTVRAVLQQSLVMGVPFTQHQEASEALAELLM